MSGAVWLGLDVGSSRMRHAWLPGNGGGTGGWRGVNPVVHGEAAAVRALALALRELASGSGRVQQAVVAMAGAGDRELGARIAKGLRSAGVPFPVAVTGDIAAAAAAALADGPGVALWSGTGSFAVARGADGRLRRVGGRGWLCGDDGSGYDLVVRACRAALRAVDGLGPATALTEALCAAFGAETPGRLGAAVQPLEPAQVAARLPVVLAAAAAGDGVAQAGLDEGAAGLLAMVEAAAARAGLRMRGLRVAFGGGVLHAAVSVRTRLERALSAAGTASPALVDDLGPARGAAALAEALAEGRQPLAGWIDAAP